MQIHKNNDGSHISLWQTEDSDVLLACIRAFQQVFSALISSKEMHSEKQIAPEGNYRLSVRR